MTDTPLYLDLFLEALSAERGCSPNTLEAYGRDIRTLQSYLAKDLDSVSPDDIRGFLAHLHRQALDSRSIARYISSLRQCFHFLFVSKYIIENPMQGIETPKQGRALPKTLSPQEVAQLIEGAYQMEGAEGARLVCFLELLYASGLRISELVALPFGAIVSALRSNHNPLPLPIVGKGNKERVILLSTAAQTALRAYINVRPHFLQSQNDTNPYLFPSRSQQGHITRQRVGQLLKDLCVEVGIPPSKVSPHILRHAFATHMLHNGADLLSLQKLLGHADISTTEIYTHVQPDKLMEAVAIHHPLSKRK